MLDGAKQDGKERIKKLRHSRLPKVTKAKIFEACVKSALLFYCNFNTRESGIIRTLRTNEVSALKNKLYNLQS